MKGKAVSTMTLLAVLWAGVTMAQDLIIFPAKGQSQDQMEKDKFECYSWAKQQTGFDPMATPRASSPPPQQSGPQGEMVRGAARGALVGGVVGGIAHDNAGRGAAAGAAGGALVGGMRRRDRARSEAQEEQQWASQQAAQYNASRSTYNRACSACLEAKGYTVK
jgi:hypothetical protein